MAKENKDDKQSSESSTEVKDAELDSQVVKTEEEKEKITEENSPKPAPQEQKTIPYERFRQVNEEKKALEAELERVKKSSISSEEELSKKYPDWEFMEETDKAKIKREEQREMRLRKLEEQTAWDKDYKQILKQFPSLAEQEEEFKEFAYKYPGVKNLKVLAKSFLFKPEEPAEPPKRKGLEKPTGGLGKVSPIGMSLEDITRLRNTDFKAYLKAIREGRIKKIPEK